VRSSTPFIDLEDFGIRLDPTLKSNPDSHELGFFFSDSLKLESAHTDIPSRVLHPFDATTTGALNDKAPTPCRIRSRALSTPQRFTLPCSFTALSHTVYIRGIFRFDKDEKTIDSPILTA